MAPRVLLIDDEPIMHRLVTRILKDCEVTVREDAREALALIAAGESYAVILCDLKMQKMNGMEFYAALKEQKPALADRVLFLTGGATTDEASRFLQGMSGRLLRKPIEVSALRDAVAAFLAR